MYSIAQSDVCPSLQDKRYAVLPQSCSSMYIITKLDVNIAIQFKKCTLITMYSIIQILIATTYLLIVLGREIELQRCFMRIL